MKIICCVLMYNCEKQVGRTTKKLLKIKYLNEISEIIYIDNNSIDQTINTVRSTIQSELGSTIACPPIRIHKNNENYGLGGSYKIGITYGLKNDADWILFLHGDDQADPVDLCKAIDLIKDNPLACAYLGSRFMTGSKLVGYSKKREIANRFLNYVYSVVLKFKVLELGAGLSAHNLSFFKKNSLANYTNFFHFYCHLLKNYIVAKENIYFFPISWFETDQISNVKNIEIGWRTLRALFFNERSKHQFTPNGITDGTWILINASK